MRSSSMSKSGKEPGSTETAPQPFEDEETESANITKAVDASNEVDSDNESSDDDREHMLDPDSQRSGTSSTFHDSNDNIARLRKEKRLAMNRESARVRRKRKKVLIHSLESQVMELKKSRDEVKSANENLISRLRAVETELQIANATIASLMTKQMPGREAVPSKNLQFRILSRQMEPTREALLQRAHLLQHQDSVNQILHAQLSSIQQQDRDQLSISVSSHSRDDIRHRDSDLLRHIVDIQASRMLNAASTASPRESLNFHRTREDNNLLLSRLNNVSEIIKIS
jgi:hypothetical protein